MTSPTLTTDQTAALDPGDVAALVKAHSLSFHHYGGNAWITASISRTVYSAREQILFPNPGPIAGERGRAIACDSAIYAYTVDGHGGCAWTHRDTPDAACFHMIHTARYHEPWTTVADLLRKGDRLTLSWTADNNTHVVRAAGLHADELRLVVDRGDKRLTFSLGYSINPDNSARMIRRTP